MAEKPNNIVIMTGSGISAESGIATFRDKGGVWAQYDYRQVATPEGFEADPDLVHRFYNDRRRALATVEPNAAHLALGQLQAGLAARGGSLTLVTQNVDDLHERGGVENILHMHGELLKATCVYCGDIREWRENLSTALICEICKCAGGMRPYVVWFGEIPRHMEDAADALMSADLFVSIGTSGSVYPAAGFVSEARALGVDTMELNLEPSENARHFTAAAYGPATEIVPAWVKSIL
ncbi:MAG: NAD-dependent deacylase [Marinicaulis sp.]|nr:NAD-dependent deacylase [Marinicaulis sp.]NNE40972.1 NAD-dependent deacylase [Marinicaulis sp.]NNL89973.1 NAD-dependent deacylase [Marinicaulis sp.]